MLFSKTERLKKSSLSRVSLLHWQRMSIFRLSNTLSQISLLSASDGRDNPQTHWQLPRSRQTRRAHDENPSRRSCTMYLPAHRQQLNLQTSLQQLQLQLTRRSPGSLFISRWLRGKNQNMRAYSSDTLRLRCLPRLWMHVVSDVENNIKSITSKVQKLGQTSISSYRKCDTC